MFGISFAEIILILLIALVVFGPEHLPKIATQLGRMVAYIRYFKNNWQERFLQESGLTQLNDLQQEFKENLRHLQQQIQPHSIEFHSLSEENYLTFGEFLYQPEFDFNAQPELFDEL